MRKFTLYWSSLKTYEECPRKFLWGRGYKEIDVGGGPGRRKPVPVRRSAHHAVLGIAIQEVIERFYNDELWLLVSPQELLPRLMEITEKTLSRELASKYVDWREAPTREEMEKLAKAAVVGYIHTLKKHNLLGPYAKAEVDLTAYLNKWVPIGGRADMIIRRADTGVTILDGKNSKRYKNKKKAGGWITYTDPDQLRWYALCYYLCYNKQLPDRVGFVYFRYPSGDPVLDTEGKETGEIEPGIEWVNFTLDDLRGLGQRALDAKKGMDREQFEPVPSPPTCRFCDYETVCAERQAQKDENRKKRPRKPSDLMKQMDGQESNSGVFDLSFD